MQAHYNREPIGQVSGDLWEQLEPLLADHLCCLEIDLTRISREDKGFNYANPGTYHIDFVRTETDNSTWEESGLIHLTAQQS